ncbi:MAG: RNA methyltransferase, partial [Flavobacteriaceae bacterium]|nr:RNA methyltransferase [Flavobacteriaceae bacterium]
WRANIKTANSPDYLIITYDGFIEEANMPVFVADMDGANIYTSTLPKKGILVMGNEANGISKEIMHMAQHKVSIPQFGEEQKTESLNVATATAILLSEFKRG